MTGPSGPGAPGQSQPIPATYSQAGLKLCVPTSHKVSSSPSSAGKSKSPIGAVLGTIDDLMDCFPAAGSGLASGPCGTSPTNVTFSGLGPVGKIQKPSPG